MSTETVLLLVVMMLLFGVFPGWPYSKSWGYRPVGVVTVLLVIFLIWAIAGGRPLFRRTVGGDIRAASDEVKRAVR